MDILEMLRKTLELKASDLHITVGVPPVVRVNGKLEYLSEEKLLPEDTHKIIHEVLSEEQIQKIDENGEADLSLSNAGLGRFRVNAYKQRGSYSMAIRLVAAKIPSMEELKLPPVLKELALKKRGLVLVTGPTGSGKSTTLASMIDYINSQRSAHIITLEDPIEYLHRHNKSIVNQREVGHDTKSYANALRAALRQDPDVIQIGEMRDLETISIAITAAETGHLVLSTLHTLGAVQTVDRIIDVFPPYQQEQIKVQLGSVLEGVISQQLMTTADEQGRVAAFEILVANNAVRNLIREGKTHQLQTNIQTGAKFGMQSMDLSLAELFRQGIISRDTALNHSFNQEIIQKYLWM